MEQKIEQKNNKDIKIALAGNPNSGKTTLFNALTGSNQFVGNWPGVTVEKKEGKLKKHNNVIITDLPGIYSLSPYTLEEVVARNYLVQERPDAILNIVDGTNLERNLYLTTQLVELGIPVVVAVNMTDLIKKSGDKINLEELSRQLNCPVVEISALKGTGIEEATLKVLEAVKSKTRIPMHTFSGPVEHAIAHIEEAVVHNLPEEMQRWYAIKVFERDKDVLKQLNVNKTILSHVEKDIDKAEKELDDNSEAIITNERYIFIANVIKACYKKKNRGKLSASDKIDRVVTNRFLGLPIFFALMFFVYYLAMISIGQIATDWINENLFSEIIPGALGSFLDSINCAPWLSGLILDGIVAGVGSVLGFLPQIIVLFFLLSVLESCGYMARIAFIMDRIFRKFGLSGKSFIPILIGTGCGVPGIMASRTIENERDRRMTVMVTTFIPCSAKLPFIAMIATSVFGGSALVATSAYFLGMFAIITSGIILKKTKLFCGDPAPFIMELPSYHIPTLGAVLRPTKERCLSFVKRAGTIILLSTIFVWFTSSFGFTAEGIRMLSEEEINLSLLAKAGSVLAFLFAPLGWGNWKASVATITGLIAKENIVSTMSILYSNIDALVFSPVIAYSFLAFNLLCAPCFAAMGAIKNEMNSRKWTGFAITYECVFAYFVSFVIYQFGSMISGVGNVFGFIVALLVFACFIYLLFRRKTEEKL